MAGGERRGGRGGGGGGRGLNQTCQQEQVLVAMAVVLWLLCVWLAAVGIFGRSLLNKINRLGSEERSSGAHCAPHCR
jgi:hypothetical protein